jgi:glycosyltransferase involved in cell wall biosynthesis
MDNPTFSVVIPTYNRAELLRRALRSLAAQTYKNFEVIVCDDGSTDATKQVCASFSGDLAITYIWEENWGGPARPRNNGLKVARGLYIGFLDSDDWWYPDKLEVIAKYFPESDVVYHDLDVLTPEGKKYFKRMRGRKLNSSPFIDLMVNGDALSNSAVVIKKSLVDQVGGLSEDRLLIAAEDSDLWLKIARITNRFRYIPKSLGAYCRWEGNATQMSEKQIARVKALSQSHKSFLTGEDKKQHEMLLSYMVGMTRYRMGLSDDARAAFKVSVGSARWKLRLKSVYFLILIYGERIRNKRLSA